MRYFTALVNNRAMPGVTDGEQAVLFSEIMEKPPADLLEWIKRGETLPSFNWTGSLDRFRLTAPIPQPAHDIICVGKNYKAHIEELGGSADRPIPHYFSKRAHQVAGTGETVRGFFELDDRLDYEVELAVIIGKEARDVPAERVWDHIFGFTILNDFSSRRLQNEHVQWYRGKSLDGYTAMGPWICSKELFDLPPDLRVTTHVNGELRQDARTSLMIFGIDELVAELSQGITLYPGDILATGTPSGVGLGFDPPRYLKAGDTVILEIEGIGRLINRIEG